MKIIVLGDGGHGKVIQDMISSLGSCELLAVLDDKYEIKFLKNEVIYGPIASIKGLMDKDVKAVVGIGDNKTRRNIVDMLGLDAIHYASIVHGSAIVSPTATIGNGTVIMPNAVINTDTTIGEHCIINTGAIVEHENTIGHYAHISPNTTLTGNVSVGEGGNIGASATVIPGITIGPWSIVGAGSTVIRDIPSNSKAVGSPSRIIQIVS